MLSLSRGELRYGQTLPLDLLLEMLDLCNGDLDLPYIRPRLHQFRQTLDLLATIDEEQLGCSTDGQEQLPKKQVM